MTEKPPRPRPRRRLSAEERALWHTVTRSVAPLRPGAPEAPGEEAAASIPPAPVSPPSSAPPPAKPAKPAPPSLAPLAPLERRLRQRVARGSAALDARIDLHGLTQEEAHRALSRFLRLAQADGAKLVLVITGKGARSGDGERGVLRRLVPQWLRLAEFRSLVVGFEPAHATHGGEGALYVRLRRAGGRASGAAEAPR